MLSPRQEKLIELLMTSNQFFTGKELSNVFGVTDRTIRSDINHINAFLETDIIRASNKGYHVNAESKTDMGPQFHDATPQNATQRYLYIMRGLFKSGHSISLHQLQRDLCIGESQLEKDLNYLRHTLQNYPQLTLQRSNNQIKLVGHEQSKRKLFKELFVAESKGYIVDLDRLNHLFLNFDLIQVKNTMMAVFQDYHYEFNEKFFTLFIMHVATSLASIMNGNRIALEQHDQQIIESEEYQIADTFYSRLKQSLPFDYNTDEVYYLAVTMQGKRKNRATNDEQNPQYQLIKTVVKEWLALLYQQSGIDLRNDLILQQGLVSHIISMMLRVSNHYHVSNVLLDETKKHYPMVFDVAINFGRFLEKKLQIQINEDEISFLALHIGTSQTRQNEHGKLRCIIIYLNDQVFADVYVNRIQTLFKDRLEVVKVMNWVQEEMIAACSPDLILTTHHRYRHPSIETIAISSFIDSQDEFKIFQAIQQIQMSRFKMEFMTNVVQIIRRDYFYQQLDANSAEEVIDFMCDKLIADELVDQTFKDSVHEREAMSPTSFAYSFSTPHALIGVTSQRSIISIATLKNEIMWGRYPVRLVILIALEQGDLGMLQTFFEWLSQIVMKPVQLAKLLECTSFDSLMESLLI